MSLSPARQKLLFFPAVLVSGIAVGAGLRWAGTGAGRSGGDSSLPGFSGTPAREAASTTALPGKEGAVKQGAASGEPFSIHRFHAAQGLEMHRMLAQVLPEADAALVRALAEDLEKRELPEEEGLPVWKALLSRWAELDGAEAMAWAREADAKSASGKNREDSSSLLCWIALRAWVRADPKAAESVAGDNLSAIWCFLDELTNSEPKLAMSCFQKWMKTKGALLGKEGITLATLGRGLIQKWAEREPQAALTLVLTESPDDEGHWKSLAQGWAAKDAEGCGKWLTTLGGEQRQWALEGLKSAAGENPAGVSKILKDLPLDRLTGEIGLQVAGALAEKSPKDAEEWVRKQFPEGAQRDYALAKVGESLMKKDLPAAVAIMDGLGWKDWTAQERAAGRRMQLGADGKPEVIESSVEWDIWTPAKLMSWLVSRLAREDPALGVRCLEKTDPAVKADLLKEFAPAWFQQDPEAAVQWLATLPASQVNAEAMGGVLAEFKDFPPEAMRDWALRLPEGPLREALARESVSGTVISDPRKALEQLPFNDPASRRAATEEIVKQWAETEPRQALDHLLATPGVEPGNFSTLVENWTDHDPAGASAWAAALPTGPDRDGAVRGLIASLTNSEGNPDIPAALIWALELSDSAQRLETAKDLLPELPGTASAQEEVREALARPGAFTEEERETLLKLLPTP